MKRQSHQLTDLLVKTDALLSPGAAHVAARPDDTAEQALHIDHGVARPAHTGHVVVLPAAVLLPQPQLQPQPLPLHLPGSAHTGQTAAANLPESVHALAQAMDVLTLAACVHSAALPRVTHTAHHAHAAASAAHAVMAA